MILLPAAVFFTACLSSSLGDVKHAFERITEGTTACGIPSPDSSPHIINGLLPTPGEFPWQALLYRRCSVGPAGMRCTIDSSFQGETAWEAICGGALISPTHVVTAAHCFGSSNIITSPDLFRIGLGKIWRDVNTIEPGSIISELKNVRVAGMINGAHIRYGHDLAVLTLKDPVDYTNHIRPVCVDWDLNINLKPGEPAYVAGFGVTEGNQKREYLHWDRMTYRGLVSCPDFEKASTISSDKICGIKLNSTRTGRGNSGGPLTIERNGQHTLIGVVSLGVFIDYKTTQRIDSELSAFTPIYDGEHLAFLRERLE